MDSAQPIHPRPCWHDEDDMPPGAPGEANRVRSETRTDDRGMLSALIDLETEDPGAIAHLERNDSVWVVPGHDASGHPLSEPGLHGGLLVDPC